MGRLPIYAEVSVGFRCIEEVENFLDPQIFLRNPLPYDAEFLAGKAFLAYRRRGGTKTSVSPEPVCRLRQPMC